MVKQWTSNDIPDMSGKTVIITGANSGLGYESSLALAKKNATIIMACRNLDKAQSALNEIKQEVADADVHIMALDLGDLSSVRNFALSFNTQYDRLDVLMNNAGILGGPYQETVDGFEMHIGINHLGHFALTGLLLDHLLQTKNSRIVTISSGLHRAGKMNFDDLHMRRKYNPYMAYNNSKLANILFTRALDKRLDGHEAIAVAAHPGYAATNLQGKSGNFIEDFFVVQIGNRLANVQARGVWSQLYAATAPDIEGAAYYGPHLFGIRGYPAKESPSKAACNDADAERLWQVSVEATGVDYALLTPAPTQ